jgi:alkaline phosphatase D
MKRSQLLIARPMAAAWLAALLWAVPGLVALTALSAQPAADALQRIAFGSCAKESRPQPIWDAILALRPQLYLGLGDNIYGDTEDMDLLRAKWQKLAEIPGFKRLRQQCRVLMTWDDHDYGVNDGGAEYPKRRESQQVFLDFLGEPSDSPRRQQEGIYTSALFGPPHQRVQVILLDTRYHRSPLKSKAERKPNEGPYEPNPDPNATVLGEAQWQWLEAQLKVPARLRLIGTSIQFVAEDHGWEKWANFPYERQRFIDLLKRTRAEGVVFLSGDRHLAEISMMDAGLTYPLYDVTASGLTEAARVFRRLEVNRHRVATMNWGNHFGFITIDWHRDPPLVSLQIRDEDGDIRLQQKLSLGLLNPSSPSVASAPGSSEAGANGSPAEAGPTSEAETLPVNGTAQAGTPLTPEQAAKKIGQTVTVQFEVKATGSFGSRVFLNSMPDRNDPANFTIVLEKSAIDALAREKITDPRSHFRGKTVRVTGKVETFREQPQIKVTSARAIQIVKGGDDSGGESSSEEPSKGESKPAGKGEGTGSKKEPPGDSSGAAAGPKGSVAMSGPALTPADAAKKVGQTVTVTFTVQSIGAAGNRLFLNSEADRNSDANFTVVLEKAALDALAKQHDIDNPRQQLRGKKIRATGKVEKFREQPQLKITDLKNFAVLDE